MQYQIQTLMNSLAKSNKTRYEETIKNKLCLIDSEDVSQQIINYKPFYQTTRNRLLKQNKQEELTDWANNPNKWELQEHQFQPQIQQTQSAEKERKRISLISHIRYSSGSQPHEKAKRLQLSPVVVKFNAKVLSLNLQKSKGIFLKKIKQDPYLTRYSSANMIVDSKLKKQSSDKYKDLYLPFMNLQTYRSDSLPKTQRLSGILRLMKKRQPVRMRKKRNINPEDLVAIRIQ